jgi:UDP-N-acetylglucosamine 1-carboxyvinyltransferase
VIPDELGTRVRTTAVMAAAVLSRAGQVRFPLPGGDAFAVRSIDRHLVAMQQAGADVRVDRGHVHAWARGGSLRPFRFDAATLSWGPSLGATVTALLLAARVAGTSRIDHPSIEPEVTVTADVLRAAGATVEWEGATALHVTGADNLSGLTRPVPPDRIEAATLVLASAVTGGGIHLTNCPPSTFPDGLVAVLSDAGLTLAPRGSGTEVTSAGRPHPVTAQTGPHPGLPTDVQPQLTAYLTQADGPSRITERVYTSRCTHVQGLRAMGADLRADGPHILVMGPRRLHGAPVEAADIRAVTSLVTAALAAEGTSTIRGMYHLQRGYGALLPKLAALGALVTTTQDDPVPLGRNHPQEMTR